MRSAERIFQKTLGLAAAAALLLSLPGGAGARTAPLRNVPFTVSSLNTAFGVQLKIEGTYTVNETFVEVNVERALVYVSEHCPYQGRRFVNTIAVGLATNTPRGRWDIEHRSLPVFVERVLSPREEYRLSGLYFQIPRSANSDLSKRWLVFVAEETALDLPDGDPDAKGYHLAHSRRNLFAEPDAGQP